MQQFINYAEMPKSQVEFETLKLKSKMKLQEQGEEVEQGQKLRKGEGGSGSAGKTNRLKSKLS